MRLRIREAKGLHGAPTHLGHDIKLGAGGIRENRVSSPRSGSSSPAAGTPICAVRGTVEGPFPARRRRMGARSGGG